MSQVPHQGGRIPPLTLGWRLRMARESTGKGLREFADELGVSPDTLTSAEKDRRKVRQITINAYALATGVDRHWLETGEGSSHPSGPGGGPSSDEADERIKQLAERKRATGAYVVPAWDAARGGIAA